MNDLRILSRAEWPEGSEPDGLLYELAVSHAMTPKLRVVTDDDGSTRTTTESDYRHETSPMDWEFYDKPRELPELDDIAIRGTYAEVSAKAVALNARMAKMGKQYANFYPDLVKSVAA